MTSSFISFFFHWARDPYACKQYFEACQRIFTHHHDNGETLRLGYADKNSLRSKPFRLVSEKEERDLAAQEMKWEAKIPFFARSCVFDSRSLFFAPNIGLWWTFNTKSPFTTIPWFSFLRKDSPWRMLLVFIPLCGYLSHYLLLIDRISRFYSFTQH